MTKKKAKAGKEPKVQGGCPVTEARIDAEQEAAIEQMKRRAAEDAIAVTVRQG